MVSSIGSGWRSFWHTMTSNDRHASHDSPYRTGQHVPLGQSRHAPLTAVTTANDSRPDLTNPSTFDDDIKLSPPPGVSTPPRPYSPGMRSITSRGLTGGSTTATGGHRTSNDSFDTEIQMQSFTDGQPPPPPVAHSWEKIDRWLEDHLEELYDNLCDPATLNDVNELEHMLDCTLPTDVRESLQIHDGQERPGLPTGVIFGCMLLDCEEIVQEWDNWRRVNEEFLSTSSYSPPQPPSKAFGVGTSSSGASTPTLQSQGNSLWRQQLLDKQDSHPPRAVQKAYAHPSWIPLARDWGGNNIAVDLAPGPAGKWGQVIIFGRDFDCKYVVARSWASFLAMLADDFLSPHVSVDEDSGELKLKPFKQQNVEPPYLQILRWRTDQKYGRRPPSQAQQQAQAAAAAKRASTGSGLGINVSGANNGKAPARDSPYGSPKGTSAEERGRSLNRFPSRGPNASPFGIASPLARVQEETSTHDNRSGTPTSSSTTLEVNDGRKKSEELLDVRTPASSKFNSSSNLITRAEDGATPTASSPVAGVTGASAAEENKENVEEGDNATTDIKGKKADLPTPPPSTGIDHDVIEGMEKVEI